MTKPRLNTMAERAKALAQECVLFGRLHGGQWDGLTTLLVIFAEGEVERVHARAEVAVDDAALRGVGA